VHLSSPRARRSAGVLAAAVLAATLVPISSAYAVDGTDVAATYSDPVSSEVYRLTAATAPAFQHSALPAGLDITADPATEPGVVIWRVTGTPTGVLGTFAATLTITGEAEPVEFDVVVAAESATVAYSGPATVSTSGTTPAKLTATVAEADSTPGDLTQAKVAFTDTATTPATVLCAAAPVTAAGVATCEVPATKASYDLTLTVGGSYTAPVPAATKVAVQPTPETTIVSGPAEGSILLSTKATIGYNSSDPAATFVCTMDGKAKACAAPALEFKNLGKRSHVFTVASVVGGVTDPTPATLRFTVPLDDSGLKASAGWKRGASAKAFLGTFAKTNRAGATLTRKVTGATGLALVARTEKNAGSVKVFLNGTNVGVISLVRGGKWRVIDLPGVPATFTGTVRLVVSGTQTVKIDGLVVLK
jgi:hypothetical protein